MEQLREKGTAVTAGTFDGVHRGHAEVISFLKDEARSRGLRPVAVTFDRHPLEVIAPERAPRLISTPDGRDGMLREMGVDVVRIPFDEDLRRLTAREWIRFLCGRLDMRLLVTGYDHTFGSDGLGMSLGDCKSLGASEGVEVVGAPLVKGISSSEIRRAVASGDVAQGAAMLGRPFTLEGTVVHGRKLGRSIGYPTANVGVPDTCLMPGRGVYAAYAVLHDGRRMPAVVNIGTRPTVEPGGDVSVEAHVIGLHEDIYGQAVRLEFIGKIRDERRFPSLGELQEQIAADMKSAESFFSLR